MFETKGIQFRFEPHKINGNMHLWSVEKTESDANSLTLSLFLVTSFSLKVG